jgi:hypothetical protein
MPTPALNLQVHIAGIGEHYEMEAPQDRSETWLVNARKDGLLSIMTPVYPDNETMSLLHNQVGGESIVPDSCTVVTCSLLDF